MKIKSQKDFWAGLLFMAVGAAFAWGATDYALGHSGRPGPGYFPLGLGVLLALLGAAVLVGALSIETADGDPIGPWVWRPLLVIAASVVLFGWLLPRTGLLVALPVLVVCASWAGNEFRWREALLNAAALTLLAWTVFVWGLELVIPVWPPLLAR